MEELRIVLLGKRGAGKSSTGNTLLGKQPFHTAASSQGVTKDCSVSTSNVDRYKISVVDTPGWSDIILMDEKIILEIAEWIDQSDPGPHVFLLVLPIGRFTKEEIDTVQQILEVFGEEAHKYTMVLFTRGDDLEEKTIEDYLKGVHPDLKKILEVCGGRYHVFNNRDKRNHKQVSDFLKKIKHMAKRNEGRHYTKAMYQKTVEQMEENWKRERITKAVREEVEKEMNDSEVGSNGETMKSKKAKLKPSPYREETVSTPSADKTDRSQMGMQINPEVERMMKNMMQAWLKENSEMKELQENVRMIMSVLEQQQVNAFNKLKAERKNTGSIPSHF